MPIQCSRCGLVFEAYLDVEIKYHQTALAGKPKEYHLCPKCGEKLRDFIEK